MGKKVSDLATQIVLGDEQFLAELRRCSVDAAAAGKQIDAGLSAGSKGVNTLTTSVKDFTKEEKGVDKLGKRLNLLASEAGLAFGEAQSQVAHFASLALSGSVLGIGLVAIGALVKGVRDLFAETKPLAERLGAEGLDKLQTALKNSTDYAKQLQDQIDGQLGKNVRLIQLAREAEAAEKQLAQARKDAMSVFSSPDDWQRLKDAQEAYYQTLFQQGLAGFKALELKATEYYEKQQKKAAELADHQTHYIAVATSADLSAMNQALDAAQKKNEQIQQDEARKVQKIATLNTSLEERIRKGMDETAAHNAEIQATIEASKAAAAQREMQRYEQTASAIAGAWSSAALSIIQNNKDIGATVVSTVIESAKLAIMAYMVEAMAAQVKEGSRLGVIGIAIGIAAAGTVAGIMQGYLAKVPSAAGGWQLPDNIGPGGLLINAHAGEKVLPREETRKLNVLLDSLGDRGVGPPIIIQALDGASVMRVVQSREFQMAISAVRRNGGSV